MEGDQSCVFKSSLWGKKKKSSLWPPRREVMRRQETSGFGEEKRDSFFAVEQAKDGLPGWHQWSRIHLPMQETQETQLQSLGQEDPLEEEMATHSGVLAWRIPWTEKSGRLQSIGLQRVRHDWSDWAQTQAKMPVAWTVWWQRLEKYMHLRDI